MAKRKRRGYEYRGPHHIIPRSRGGTDDEDNIYPAHLWSPEKMQHIHWHNIFENMRPNEAIRVLEKYTDRCGNISPEFFLKRFVVLKPWKDLNKNPEIKEKTCSSARTARNKESWLIVFNGMNGHEAIEWIEREFIKKAWLKSLPQRGDFSFLKFKYNER